MGNSHKNLLDTFWKRTTQESFQQSLVEIGSVVSEEKILLDGSLPKMYPAVRPFDQDGPHSRT
jgi:hypothetical protein